MPSVEENLAYWGEAYPWSEQGDEWSETWGDSETLWHATLLPRIRHFLPTGTILEIAPGYGRWTQFLLEACDRYVGVDLAESCVAACRDRFRDVSSASFVTNDGRKLPDVEDASIDFAFSFDSLVHVEIDVMESYLRELARTLTQNGVAFLHHSNLGQHASADARAKAVGRAVRPVPLGTRALHRLRVAGWDNSRAPSVSASAVADLSAEAGLACIGQEVISWDRRTRRTIDCLSLLTCRGSRWERPNVVVQNPQFTNEARSARAVAAVFTSPRRRDADQTER